MAMNFRLPSIPSGLTERLGLNGAKPPFEGYYIYGLLFFMGYLTADMATTQLRGNMLPVGGITRARPAAPRAMAPKKASLYASIEDKNIFNSDHVVPETVAKKTGGAGGVEEDSAPVPTSLPLELVGTIIHSRHEMSVATIQIRGKDIFALKEEDKLENMAQILEIARFKVIFRNLENRKLEYIEIKEENKIRIGLSNSGPKVDEPMKTNFTLSRDEVNKQLANLTKVLQDAKAVPWIIPGSGGEVGGWKMVAIKQGSIFSKLGLLRGDILQEVNGEFIDSPQKAMETYQSLKDASNIQLRIRRGSSATTLNYSIE